MYESTSRSARAFAYVLTALLGPLACSSDSPPTEAVPIGTPAGPSGAAGTPAAGGATATSSNGSTPEPAANRGQMIPAGDAPDEEPAGMAPSEPSAEPPAGGAAPSDETSAGDPQDAWLSIAYDLNNRYFNPVEKQISVATAPMLAELWRFEVAGYPTGSPVVVDGKVYALATGGMYALDLETGQEIWSRSDITGNSSVAYRDGVLYVHAAGQSRALGEIHKLDAADGRTIWGPFITYDLDNCDAFSSPQVAGGKVLVGHSCGPRELALDGTNAGPRGGVEAFDTETGERVYTYWSVPESGEDGAMSWSTVAIDLEDNAVFASTGNNYTVGGPNSDAIHKFDLATGMKIWVTQVRADDVWGLATGNVKDTDFGASSILVEVDGKKLVACGDKDSAFWAMDRESGMILWSRKQLTPSRSPSTGGVLNNGGFDGKHFVVASNDANTGTSKLYKLDPLTGADVWVRDFDKTVWGSPSMANGVIVAPINDDLHILDGETGETIKMFNTGGTTAGGAAAIAQGKIVVKSGLSYPLSNAVVNNNLILAYGLQ
jgi:polyvinyl alcohol dehydrogenase (cytochrome)